MTGIEILRPMKGHALLLVAAATCLAAAAALSVWATYSVLTPGALAVSPTQVAWIGLLWVVVIPLAAEPGRYVAFDDGTGLSMPALFRRRKPRFITSAEVGRFAKFAKAGNPTQMRKVVIETRDGRRIRYSEARTPGCAARVLDLMRKWGVLEDPGLA
jgi:hypothetical protein